MNPHSRRHHARAIESDPHGICKILEVYPTSGSFAGFEYDKQDPEAKTLATVWTDVVATWNSQTGYFREGTKTQAPYAGLISMVLRCAGDPVLTGVTCKGLSYANTTGWSGFDYAYTVPRPISRGKTSLAEATALSQQHVANTPPPPPPAPTPTTPTIQRLPMPTRTAPVAVASPQIALAPVPSRAGPWRSLLLWRCGWTCGTAGRSLRTTEKERCVGRSSPPRTRCCGASRRGRR